MTVALVLALAALATLAGLGVGRVAGWRSGSAEEAVVVGFAGGALLLHLTMLLADLAGLPWSRAVVLAPLLVAAAASLSVRWPRPRPGWSDEMALAAVAAIGGLSLLGWAGAPDFVYHWGAKGERFFLARGLDLAYLTSPWHQLHVRPDYPNLLPNLFAAVATLRGFFRATAGLLWGPVVAALLLVAGRRVLRRPLVDPAVGQLGVATLALYLLASWQVLRRSGDGDGLIALALLAAAPYLLRPPRPADDLPVGLLAAFAAASKLEGVALASFLVASHALRRVRDHRHPGERPGPAALARLVVPSALVLLPWAWTIARHDLGSEAHAAAFRPERIGAAAAAMLEIALHPLWLGFGALVLLLVPLLALPQRTRWLGLLLLSQLGFYAFVYTVSPLQLGHLVQTTFFRLLWQLSPAALVGAFVWLGKEAPATVTARRGENGEPQGTPPDDGGVASRKRPGLIAAEREPGSVADR